VGSISNGVKNCIRVAPLGVIVVWVFPPLVDLRIAPTCTSSYMLSLLAGSTITSKPSPPRISTARPVTGSMRVVPLSCMPPYTVPSLPMIAAWNWWVGMPGDRVCHASEVNCVSAGPRSCR